MTDPAVVSVEEALALYEAALDWDGIDARPFRAALLAAIEREKTEAVLKLREFVEFVMKEGWQGYDIDGGDAQDKAETLGLIVKVPADEDFKAEWDLDEMFVIAWSDASRQTEGREG